MARRRRAPSGGAASWLTTYGDMVTLLLTFFVFLFSFSTIDVKEFKKMLFSFKGAIGALPGGRTFQVDRLVGAGARGKDAGESIRQTKELQEVISRLTGILKEAQAEKQVFLRVDERGVTVSFTGDLLFDPGSVEIRPEGRRLLYKVGETIRVLRNPVAVEGHTDDVPISTPRFPSNWELSAGRAAAVVRYLVDEVGFDPLRLHAVGYGQHRPVVPNDGPENRALNRRVDLVILTSERIFP